MEEIEAGNWLDMEEKAIKEETPFIKMEGMKFEEDKLEEIDIDFSKPFEKLDVKKFSGEGLVKKVMIPLKHKGLDKIWWLNVRNGIYPEIIRQGREGKKHFKVLQTGKGINLRYKIIKE